MNNRVLVMTSELQLMIYKSIACGLAFHASAHPALISHNVTLMKNIFVWINVSFSLKNTLLVFIIKVSPYEEK